MRKKVAKLLIKCKFYERNCPWTGVLAEWEAHLTKCQFGERTCPDCNTNIENSKVSIPAVEWVGAVLHVLRTGMSKLYIHYKSLYTITI